MANAWPLLVKEQRDWELGCASKTDATGCDTFLLCVWCIFFAHPLKPTPLRAHPSDACSQQRGPAERDSRLRRSMRPPLRWLWLQREEAISGEKWLPLRTQKRRNARVLLLRELAAATPGEQTSEQKKKNNETFK